VPIVSPASGRIRVNGAAVAARVADNGEAVGTASLSASGAFCR
jgi:hypothetical protein